MPSKKTSSVVLTPEAQKIKDRIAGAFSLKGIFSAGLIWFNRLDTETMIDIVSAAKKNSPLLPLIESIDHSLKIKKAITLVQKVKDDFGGSKPAPLDVQWLCNELLRILTTPKIQEDIAEKTQGELSRAMHIIKKMSPDGSLDIEFLSEEDRQAVHELAKLTRPEDKKSDKDKTA